jgi:branched-chain amino acid transport system substrate-binding protein
MAFKQEETMRWKIAGIAGLMAVALATAPLPGRADEPDIKIGVVATLDGAFAVLGQDAVRGVELAVAEVGGQVAGRKITILKASSDASPDSAIAAARKPVENDGVDVLVGPLSGDEGIAVKDYAKNHPAITFVNGTSAAQDTTLRDPAPNFFRFTSDGAQWMAGLGDYAYKEKNYRRVAIVAEDYSFPYTQVFGFMYEFCALGGHVVTKQWVPIGQKDFSSVVAAIPQDIDAVYVALAGADAVNFLTQMHQGGNDKPMIAGSFTADQTILSSKGRFRDYVLGTPSAGAIADSLDDPDWKAYVAAYRKQFPDGLGSPSLAAYTYYLNTAALLRGLQAVNGDLSDGHQQLHAVLSKLSFKTPTGGEVHLDENRQAVIDNFVTEIAADSDGKLYNKVIRRVVGVNQTLGMDREKFLALGQVSRDNPSCP